MEKCCTRPYLPSSVDIIADGIDGLLKDVFCELRDSLFRDIALGKASTLSKNALQDMQLVRALLIEIVEIRGSWLDPDDTGWRERICTMFPISCMASQLEANGLDAQSVFSLLGITLPMPCEGQRLPFDDGCWNGLAATVLVKDQSGTVLDTVYAPCGGSGVYVVNTTQPSACLFDTLVLLDGVYQTTVSGIDPCTPNNLTITLL